MPSVSLSMIVKNVEKIIENCLRSVIHVVDEIVIVDTGSHDGTKEAIRRLAPQTRVLDFLPETHPAAFLLDSQETWGTKMPGPFTDRYMLTDFSAARNFGLDHCTKDYVLWIDSDDVLERGENVPKILAEMARDDIDACMANYDYASDGRGNVTCKLTRERIVKRDPKRIRWTQPIHEVLFPLGKGHYYDDINIKHRRHEYAITPEQQHRNLKVLSKWWDIHKDDRDLDARMIFYLAMEERFIWPDLALGHFNRYCKISGWDEERGMAHMLAGIIQEHSGKYDEAFAEYAQAALESSFNPDSLFGAARCTYYKQDWNKCIEYTERGFEIWKQEHGRKSVLMYDPLDRLYRPYIYYSVALVETCQMKKAIEACDAGLRWNPEDPHLIGNKELAQNWITNKQKEAVMPGGSLALKFQRSEPLEAPSMDIPPDLFLAFAIQMWKKHMEEGDHTRASQLLDSVPRVITNEPKIREAREISNRKRISTATVNPPPTSNPPPHISASAIPVPSTATPAPLASPAPTSHAHVPVPIPAISTDDKPRLSIAIWTGPAWEKWSPLSLDTTGLGGSETAAICMARELQKRGHTVTVLADCLDDTYEGVRYVDFRKCVDRPQDYACDVLVCSRQAWLYKDPPPFKVSILWVHDINVGQPTADLGECLIKPDKIYCLSNWHKSYFLSVYPFLHRDTIVVTRNGIDVKYFAREPRKEGNRIIYSSSPDRGLEKLLELMPAIRAQVPDVELSVYYGFETWKKMAESSTNPAEKDRIAYFEKMLEEHTREGLVKYHGRVPKQTLADAFLASKVWTYPTWFSETNCITALEAQAAGCVPVTTDQAALSETVGRDRGFLLDPPNTTPQYALAFVSQVVSLLQDETERKKYATAGRQHALANGGWDKVAAEWENHFHVLLKNKSQEPVILPAFGDF